MAYVNVLRPGAPDASGKISGLITVISSLPVDLQPVSHEATLGLSGATIFNTYWAFVETLPLPDVRVQDRLENAGETDPLTQAPAEYRVIGVRRWEDHLEVLCQRQEGK